MKTNSLVALGVLAGLAATTQATLVYAVDMRGNRFVTFDTLAPGAQTVLNASYLPDYFGMDFNAAATNLYGVKTVTGVSSVERLSLADGSLLASAAITGIDSGATVTGLTIDGSNTAYLSAGGSAGYKLYNLNLTTGAAGLIGTMSANIIIDIAVDTAGRMVAHNISTDTFHFVNTATGGLTLIGGHGLTANFAQGMDFDWSNNVLYAAVYTGGGTLTYGSVSLTTGAVTSIPGIISGEYEMAVQSAVPEPATLTALSLGALALLRRRKR